MFTLDEKTIEDAFYAAGFDDVMFDEECVARRAAGDVWEVVLDKSGRIKATRTRTAAEPTARTHAVRERSANVLIERSEVATVMFQLSEADELVDFLAALDHIDEEPPTTPTARTSDDDIWDDEDVF